MKHVIVCGSRDWDDEPRLHTFLNTLLLFEHRESTYPWVKTLIHGMARGADQMAVDWARNFNAMYEEMEGVRSVINIKTFPANWDEYGRSAGPRRNQQMLDYLLSIESDPERDEKAVIAFFSRPNSTGTQDMIDRALRAGIPVIAYYQGTRKA